MPDAAAFAGAIASLKTASEIAKALINLRDTTTFQTKLIELQGEILSAQSSALAAQADQFTLLESKRELEKEVAELKAWNAQAEKYKLTEMSQWTHVTGYSLKEQSQAGEPPHFLCANCFTNRSISILQPEQRFTPVAQVLFCPRCKTDFFVTGGPNSVISQRRRT